MKVGDRYRHRKGKIYTIISLPRCAEIGRSMVVYAGDDNQAWVHTMANFLECGRFTLLDGGCDEDEHF